MNIINITVQEHPILVDKYLMGREVEVDGVFDGEDVLIPGIMEHVERAGIHSGDSIAVYPPLHIDEVHKQTILKHTRNLAKHLGVIGLINVQFIIYNDTVYIIEANPRSSRTIPYISKVTNVPIIDLATKVMLGAKLKDLGVNFYDIDVAELQAAYQAKAEEKGFTFDPEWQAAVDEAIASVAN